jgi:outer membrane protein TolC
MRRAVALVIVAVFLVPVVSVRAQLVPSTSPSAASTRPSAPAPAGPSELPSSNQLSGAFRRGTLTKEVIALDLEQALTRGLEYNVGLVVSGRLSDQARATRLAQLSELLPTLDASLRESRQRTNLAALGISLPAIPPTVDVSNFDARLTLAAPILDLHARSNARAAAERVDATNWDARNVRELVVLAIASTYLQTVSAEASFESAEADRATAESLFEFARDRERAGVSPEIDMLRAQVELQARRQSSTVAANALAKQRVALLRIVGLPLNQPLALTSRLLYKPLAPVKSDDAFARAMSERADYKSADAQVRAAETARRAAALERTPTIVFNGDVGEIGTAPSNALATWTATGLVRMPIFVGARIQADVAQADAVLAQRKAERDDLTIAIEQEVTDALLDVTGAGQQVDVATITVTVAQQALTQAQDRFSAGVTNNVEVIQAQEALVNANNQYVAALQAHNLAKMMLARAMGSAEHMWKELLAQ